jgi:hypothetical protein
MTEIIISICVMSRAHEESVLKRQRIMEKRAVRMSKAKDTGQPFWNRTLCWLEIKEREDGTKYYDAGGPTAFRLCRRPHPARVWQIPRAVIDDVRAAKPELFYRMAGHVARHLSARLRAAGEQLSGGAAPVIATWRMEHDLLGERELPDPAYYGVQTLRGMENFPLSGIPLRHFQHFVRALAFVKKAAAAANSELGVLGRERRKPLPPLARKSSAGSCTSTLR